MPCALPKVRKSAGLDFIEQPLAAHDLDGTAEVARATRVPVSADEGIHSLADIERHHATGAARGASLKTIKLGGLGAVMTAGRRLDALGMHVNLAGKIAEFEHRQRRNHASRRSPAAA